ncbi:MAG: HaeIII family restriction endonuclease [Mogibacterium sp.]|nr:HaeIII family restriction endonuclease [Mogibacterium sp.]
MINKLLVAAVIKSFEDILTEKDVPYTVRDDDETRLFMKTWDDADESERNLAIRQARPAIRKIASMEPYLFLKDGEPLSIRLNFLTRELKKDSFGEIMLERPELGWRFSISVKNDARVISTMTVADRAQAFYMDKEVNVFNEIDDFGDRIFGVPCSNDYFDEVNEILQKIEPSDKITWKNLLKNDDFAFDEVITPMLNAMSREIKRICQDHPEAPMKLIEYFYGKIDYYYINPLSKVQLTRIGAVNAHGGLGRIPDNHNLMVPRVKIPRDLLDIREGKGEYGELSKDTIQLSFDGGWAVCIQLGIEKDVETGRHFALNVYLPVTPFGSYRDQVEWEEA